MAKTEHHGPVYGTYFSVPLGYHPYVFPYQIPYVLLLPFGKELTWSFAIFTAEVTFADVNADAYGTQAMIVDIAMISTSIIDKSFFVIFYSPFLVLDTRCTLRSMTYLKPHPPFKIRAEARK